MAELPYFLPTTLPGDTSTTPPLDPTESGGGGGTLTPITDLCGQSIDLLIKQYAESPNLQALVCAVIDRVQELDNAIADVYARVLDVENAEGVHIDLLGRLVGEVRGDLSDSIYKRAILTKILINRSQGRVRDLIAVARTFAGLGDDDQVRIREIQPARIQVFTIGALIVGAENLYNRLRRAKAAGVALQSITLPPGVPTTRVFVLGDVADYPESGEFQGLGDVGDPDWGGYLAHVLG